MKTSFLFFILLGIGTCWSQQKTENMDSKNVITVDIWSDIVCPFCYIGKAKLENAIAYLNAKDKVVIKWHSFQLDPDFPMGVSVPSAEYLAKRKGYPVDQINAIQAQLTSQAKQYGIDFQFEKSLSFNTLDAHRLWKWSEQFNQASALKTALMKAYFTEGLDLSKKEVLLQVVENVGLDKAKASEILANNSYANEVQADIQMASKIGIRGVPFFILNNKYSISGAQDDSVFKGALQELLNELPATTATESTGAVCEPNGKCD